MLRSGSLPASLTDARGADGGPVRSDATRFARGVLASLIGFIALIAAVLLYYRGAGVNAVIALLLNLVILLGMMAYFKATLTLPVSRASFSRSAWRSTRTCSCSSAREELREGKTVRASIEQGFSRASGPSSIRT